MFPFAYWDLLTQFVAAPVASLVNFISNEWTMKKGEFFHKVCVQQHDTTCVFCLSIWLLCYQNKMRGGVNFYHFLK
jgi:hypothetical protein